MSSRTRSGPVAGVPEGVPVAARLEHEFARHGEDLLVVLEDAEPALEHQAVLVLAAVPVDRRGQHPRCERVLDHRDQAAESAASSR